MLANPQSNQIPYRGQEMPYFPPGIDEAFIDAETAMPLGGCYFVADVNRIIEKNYKMKGQNIIIKYDLPHVKAIAYAHFNGKTFSVAAKKAEIVEFLTIRENLEKIRNNPIPIRCPEKKNLNVSSKMTVSVNTTPVSSPTHRPPGIVIASKKSPKTVSIRS